ncbi:acyltransferase GLAUCE [Quercus suber]|uniref:Rosmarinate synthase n=1 Tax=Quercus suber TaxID=58331 RepID=A0AAW0KPS2_QUESU
MGTIYQGPPSLLQDLKVTVHKSSLVFPSQETEKRTLFLSNIDQVLNFDVETVHFFSCHKDFSPKIVADTLKNTLAKILVPYDFFAGRLKLNSETSRLEIDCNAAGAGFVVASSEYTLDEIGDLVYPNPAFAQLVCKTSNFLKPDDQPLCIFQLTSFKCGGFAMGLSINHTTLDGLSFKLFLDNLAALGHNKPLAVTLSHDRHLLASRSPPHVTFPHPELVQLKIPTGQDSNPPVFVATQEDLAFNIFRLTSDNINSLKEKAKAASGVHPNARITGFNVVTAHIWQCKALSCDTRYDLRCIANQHFKYIDLKYKLRPHII